MARFARLTIPGIPHHVIQRGNRKQTIFFGDYDRELYLRLLCNAAAEHKLDILAYCLMTNHIHLIVIPRLADSLARGIGDVHRRYSCHINLRNAWCGYLFQGRFRSYVMDETYLYHATRYVENNPVKAGLVLRATDYTWSSARAHCGYIKDAVLGKFQNHIAEKFSIKNWQDYLEDEALPNENEDAIIEKHLSTGRPCGSLDFCRNLEILLGRPVLPQKPGRKKIRGHDTQFTK